SPATDTPQPTPCFIRPELLFRDTRCARRNAERRESIVSDSHRVVTKKRLMAMATALLDEPATGERASDRRSGRNDGRKSALLASGDTFIPLIAGRNLYFAPTVSAFQGQRTTLLTVYTVAPMPGALLDRELNQAVSCLT